MKIGSFSKTPPSRVPLGVPVAIAVLASGVLALVALGASDGATMRPGVDPEEATLQATWAFRPGSVEQLARESSLVVTASVVDIRTGQPLTDRSGEDAGEPGEQAIPTQLIDLEVDRTLRGDLPTRVTILKTGSVRAWIDGDPLYRVAERYLLFLTESTTEAGAYVPPAPDGRLLIEDGVVKPLIDGAVGDLVGGQSEADVRELILRRLPVR